MKKLMIFAIGVLSVTMLSAATSIMRSDDMPIKFAELPTEAQLKEKKKADETQPAAEKTDAAETQENSGNK